MHRPQPDKNVSLKLTAAERAVLLDERTPLPPDLQDVIGDGSASKPILLTANEAQRLFACVIVETEQAMDNKRKKAFDAISGKVYSSIHSQLSQKTPRPGKARTAQPKSTADRPSRSSSTGAKPKQLYQFKITLLGIEPPIWRRIQVSRLLARQAPRTHPDGNGLDQQPSSSVRHQGQALRRSRTAGRRIRVR